jgi:polyisoprenoid-binding protein YceI
MKPHRCSALVLGLLILAAPLAHAANLQLGLQKGSRLWLEGSSTVHEYSSTASELKATLAHDPASWDAALPRAEAIEKLIRAHGVTALEVIVPVQGMHSGKSGLDKNMAKALNASAHPDIRFVLSDYKVAEGAKPGEMAIDARGKLTVAGVTKDVAIAVSAAREEDILHLRGRVPLKMTQFEVKPPTMMMGALRTSDDVTVQFDLRLGAGEPLADSDGKGGSQ